MPKSKRPGWIAWKKSETRCILIEDLVQGILPLEDEEVTAEEAWEVIYKNMAEIVQEGVVFSQFKERLRDHRRQVKGDLGRALEEEEMYLHDRLLFPRQETNPDGTPVFDLHPARDLLRMDVKANKHKIFTPSELWRTREQYQVFKLAYFRNRIYQTERRQKFINHLKYKREVKKQLLRCKPPTYEYMDEA